MFSKLLGVLALVVSTSAIAASTYKDSEYMPTCQGYVTLRQSDSGDLAINFKGLNEYRCDDLKFYDVSSGRTIKSYQIKGTSYTLSKTMVEDLSEDCRLGFTVSGPRGRDNYNVVILGCRPTPVKRADSAFSFQISKGGGNCKLMRNGTYQNRNVSEVFCAPASGNSSSIVNYEWSANGHCKTMVNGRYTNANVSDFFCEQ